ncbi:unnamed protein product, partial [Didymodactylos carnosus]
PPPAAPAIHRRGVTARRHRTAAGRAWLRASVDNARPRAVRATGRRLEATVR